MNIQATEMEGMPPVKSAANVVKTIIYNNPGLSAHLIVSGWDPYEGYQIYDINQTGFVKPGNYAIGGSGGVFLRGYIQSNYREDMTREEAKELVTSAISLAAFRDSSSGGCIRTIDLTQEKVTREFIPYSNFKIK
jgi:20S proteasome subunit beta 1